MFAVGGRTNDSTANGKPTHAVVCEWDLDLKDFIGSMQQTTTDIGSADGKSNSVVLAYRPDYFRSTAEKWDNKLRLAQWSKALPLLDFEKKGSLIGVPSKADEPKSKESPGTDLAVPNNSPEIGGGDMSRPDLFRDRFVMIEKDPEKGKRSVSLSRLPSTLNGRSG